MLAESASITSACKCEVTKCYNAIMKESSNDFLANRELVDSIKIEASSLSPHSERYIQSATSGIISALLSEYGRYILPDTYQKSSNINNRVLVAPHETVQILRKEWTQQKQEHPVDGFHCSQGHLIIVSEPDHYWQQVSDRLKNEAIEKNNGNKEQARQYIGWMGFIGTLTHELIHNFEDHNLPDLFLEAGVINYQREIILYILHQGYLVNEDEENLGMVYHNMIKQYGDDVHRIFFGSHVDHEKKLSILSNPLHGQVKRQKEKRQNENHPGATESTT